MEQGIDILKKLSPENQTYFMTLLRVAFAAECGAKSALEASSDSGKTA